MRFPVRAMAGDPTPPIAEPKTFQLRDRSISFGLRPSRRQDIIFALSSPIKFLPSASGFPQFLKLFNRRRSKSRVMVVYVDVRRDSTSDRPLTYIHPTH